MSILYHFDVGFMPCVGVASFRSASRALVAPNRLLMSCSVEPSRARSPLISQPRRSFPIARLMAKKISDQSLTSQQGVNLIEQKVLEMGFAWHATSGTFDVGIDGYIELRDPVSHKALNEIVQVQSKATTRPFTAETENGFEFLCEEKDIDYWMAGNAPVILVVSRPSSKEAYWVSIKDYFRDLDRRRGRKVLLIRQGSISSRYRRRLNEAWAIPPPDTLYQATGGRGQASLIQSLGGGSLKQYAGICGTRQSYLVYHDHGWDIQDGRYKF